MAYFKKCWYEIFLESLVESSNKYHPWAFLGGDMILITASKSLLVAGLFRFFSSGSNLIAAFGICPFLVAFPTCGISSFQSLL